MTAMPASLARRRRSEYTAGTVPLPGSARPSTSARQFIELAVNMPEHEPQVGQAAHSSALRPSSSSSPAMWRPTPSKTVLRSITRPPCWPASIAPPPTITAGMFEAHRRHEHAGDDLVAARHQHERVEGVAHGHGLDAVGDQLAAGQRVEHALVVHGDAVADADDAELEGRAAGHAHAGLDRVDDLAQVHVAGNDLAERVGDADERALHLGVAHAEGAQQRAVRGALPAALDLVASHLDATSLPAGPSTVAAVRAATVNQNDSRRPRAGVRGRARRRAAGRRLTA